MTSLTLLQPASQAWALVAFFAIFFSFGLLVPSWALYRRTGINPLVLPRDDTALGYIGKAFKCTLALLFVYLLVKALQWWPTEPMLWFTPAWLAALAWCGLCAAMLGMLLAQHHMGNTWRIGIDTQHATELVSHGLFRYSRNPVFLAMRCSMLFLLILQPSAIVLALAASAELLMQIQVRMEEDHLQQLHGASYAQYRQRVRRWL
jgi:protein-S-isoprenylcysteine O-methyltransferase Ste14